MFYEMRAGGLVLLRHNTAEHRRLVAYFLSAANSPRSCVDRRSADDRGWSLRLVVLGVCHRKSYRQRPLPLGARRAADSRSVDFGRLSARSL